VATTMRGLHSSSVYGLHRLVLVVAHDRAQQLNGNTTIGVAIVSVGTPFWLTIDFNGIKQWQWKQNQSSQDKKLSYQILLHREIQNYFSYILINPL